MEMDWLSDAAYPDEPATPAAEPVAQPIGLEPIASFRVDHTVLSPGLYVSHTVGDATVYDLRFVRPNTPPYLSTGSVHTIEHLFSTFVYSSAFSDRIVHFGPMGCRTGFTLITRQMTHEQVISLTREALTFVGSFEGEIPGANAADCGNCQDHDLKQAKTDAVRMLAVLYMWSEADLRYPRM